MKIYETESLDERQLKPQEREWVYNGFDACVTAEVLQVLLPQLDNQTASTYAFSRALQGPVLEMRCRGVLVDKARKSSVIEELQSSVNLLEQSIQQIAEEAFDTPEFNHRSPKQLQELFYGTLEIPPIRRRGRVSADRDALERLELYTVARPVAAYIIAVRELEKKISVLKTGIDHDGRIRTSYNIAGTNTGRFSSSFSEFGTGGNLQNVEELLRSIFIADEGMKMAYLDAEQGESRCVGAIMWNLFKDGRYLDACEGGDLHTTVARIVWPDLGWAGNLKLDKALAEEPYYRHYSRRFMCKKIGHGSNYGGQPRTLADQAKVDVALIEDFQPPYFEAYGQPNWHEWVKREILRTGKLTSLTGRLRHFLGRRDDPETQREAIAYDPQGSLADIVNNGMLRVWRERDCQLLMQNHDAIVVQYPENREDDVIPKLIRQLRYPVDLRYGREFVIPYGVKTGWNFGAWSKDNPDGLKDYKEGDKRKRTPTVSILDRPLRRGNQRNRVGENIPSMDSDNDDRSGASA